MINKEIWAITSYFNPCGYKIRLNNYKNFRKHLNIPLIAVELSFNGKYELEPSDADILVRIKGKDIMWQKERLLNIALDYLPQNCEKVVWIDCDIIFPKRDWSIKTSNLLDKYKIVQPFKVVTHLPHLSIIKNNSSNPTEHTFRGGKQYSFAFYFANKDLVKDIKLAENHTGMVWAIRKDIILHHKFYDSCIIGGGDSAMALAASGKMRELQERRPMNQMQIKHYLEWAEPFYKTINSEITFLDNVVGHLWHGHFQNRNYRERHLKLVQCNFNPYTDINIDKNGCWQWSQKNTKLRNYLSSHFSSRNEDAIT